MSASDAAGGGDVGEPPALGLDCAIVFGLTFAASLYSYRQMEAARGEWGKARTGETHAGGLITPSADAIAAVRQWIFTRGNEA